MIDRALREKAAQVLEIFRARGLKVATAESCTGGLVAGALTEIAGSSDVVDRGFVTYSNAAKEAMLAVPAATLERYGAVSAETAAAMAAGALKNSLADSLWRLPGLPARAAAPNKSPSALCISPRQAAAGDSWRGNGGTAKSAAKACASSRSPKRSTCWRRWRRKPKRSARRSRRRDYVSS